MRGPLGPGWPQCRTPSGFVSCSGSAIAPSMAPTTGPTPLFFDADKTMKTTSISAPRLPLPLSILLPLLLLGISTAVGTAFGENATRDEQAKACRGDAIHYCAAHIPNKQKIEACMKQHYDQLSPRCKAMFDPPDQQ